MISSMIVAVMVLMLLFLAYMAGFKTLPSDGRIYRVDDFKWYELPIKWFMKLAGWTGYTSPHKYYYFIGVPSVQLKRHENQHGVQMYRDGTLDYHLTYGGEFIKGVFQGKSFRQAYLDIPYEVEARTAEENL